MVDVHYNVLKIKLMINPDRISARFKSDRIRARMNPGHFCLMEVKMTNKITMSADPKLK